jgi:CIC family chloride channel protein
LTCCYGLIAGLASVAFQFCINAVYRSTFGALSTAPLPWFLAGSFATIVGTSIVAGLLLTHYCPEASGSGIPQLKLAFWKDFGQVPWRVVWVKFVAGSLSVGGGASLGREGPSVQIAGAAASCASSLFGEPKHNRRLAAAAGAAAGLAAAFNTPLAAVTFVLEEIIGDLNSRFLGSILLASVIGAFVVHGLVGPQPAFTLAPVSASSWRVYVLIPFIAGITSLIGVLFQKGSLTLRQRQRAWTGMPRWTRPVLGGLIVWALGVAIFVTTGKLAVFSLGYEDLSSALGGDMPWKLAGVLLLAKFLATVGCYGFGGCGGIFSPTLFIGGTAGLFFSGVAGYFIPLSPDEHIVLAVVGMSTCLGAVVRAPVTGILIVFEMTHEFSLVPALMLGALVSQALSRRLCPHNFYDTILEQDGHHIERLIPPRDLRSWQHLPISTIANFKPVTLDSFESTKIEEILKTTQFRFFPVVREGVSQGVATRAALEASAMTGAPPQTVPAPYVLPTDSVRSVQAKLIESASGIVLVTDVPNGRLLAVVTLHDLLRAELSVADQQGE